MSLKKDGKYNIDSIKTLILDLLDENEFSNVKELADTLKEKYFIPTEVAIEVIESLEEEGKISLDEPRKTKTSFESLKDKLTAFYGFNKFNIDFWAPFALCIGGLLAALLIPESVFPVNIVRWILGGLMVLGLPGYSLTFVVFPEKKLDEVELIALSLGLSLAVSPLIGVILNFTPWGITLTTVTLCLSSFTLITLTIGKYLKMKKAVKNLH
ncbi:MAG: DUF1616 domain-containing protein [Candidatus Odinarchaeia archaeon]